MQGDRRSAGFSVIELLILIAILGLIAGALAVNGRRMLAGQQEKAAINSVRQAIWEGATAAAARGVDTRLVRTQGGLEVQLTDGTVLRSFDLPAGVATNLPALDPTTHTAQVLSFTPPGRVDSVSYAALPDPLTLTVNGHTVKLRVSVIGEVKVTS